MTPVPEVTNKNQNLLIHVYLKNKQICTFEVPEQHPNWVTGSLCFLLGGGLSSVMEDTNTRKFFLTGSKSTSSESRTSEGSRKNGKKLGQRKEDNVAVCHNKVKWYKCKERKWWEVRGQGGERRMRVETEERGCGEDSGFISEID